MNLILLTGSFHSASRTQRLARAMVALLPGHRCVIPDLAALPFYCEDLNRDRPAVVREFIELVTDSDAIVCVTPEYNHSIPAVLKNAIDWASRPAFASPLKGRPATVVTQAEGPVGGARAQAHVKLVLDATLALVFPSHEMMIAGVDNVLDAGGEVVDAAVRRRLQRHLDTFVAFAERHRERS